MEVLLALRSRPASASMDIEGARTVRNVDRILGHKPHTYLGFPLLLFCSTFPLLLKSCCALGRAGLRRTGIVFVGTEEAANVLGIREVFFVGKGY